MRSHLLRTYARGEFSGWMHGVDHQKLVDGSFSGHRGEFIGLIKSYDRKKIVIQTDQDLQAGMGLLFVDSLVKIQSDKKENFKGQKIGEFGAKIMHAFRQKNNWIIELWNFKDYDKIKVDQKVYINSDPQIEKNLQRILRDKNLKKKISIDLFFNGKIGFPLEVSFSLENFLWMPQEKIPENVNSFFSLSSDLSCEVGIDKFLDEQYLEHEFKQLGDSCFQLGRIHTSLDQKCFLNSKELKKLKSKILQRVLFLRNNFDAFEKKEISFESLQFKTSQKEIDPSTDLLRAGLVLRSIEQFRYFVEFFKENIFLCKKFIGEVILDFEYGRNYQQCIDELKSLSIRSGVATTRILKAGETHHLNTLVRLNPDLILVRNIGSLNYLKKRMNEQSISIDLKADFSFNVTNSLSFNFLNQFSLKSICASYDLNSAQLLDLAKNVDVSRLEVTLHQYLPMFHMEHCVFAAFLSKGSSFKDCGRPCEKHQVSLKDMYGNTHHLHADQECRNTLFQGKSQSALKIFNPLYELGIRNFRIEFLKNTQAEFNTVLSSYLDFFDNYQNHASQQESDLNVEATWKLMGLEQTYGITTGTLDQDFDRSQMRKKR